MTLSSESQKWKPNWPSSSFSRQDIHRKCLASWDMGPPSPSSVYLGSSQSQPEHEVMLFSARSEEGLNGGRRGMISASIPQGISLPLGSDSMLITKVLSWEIPWHFHKYAGSITGKKTKTLCGYPWNRCHLFFIHQPLWRKDTMEILDRNKWETILDLEPRIWKKKKTMKQ